MTQVAGLRVAIHDETASGARSASRHIDDVRKSARGMDDSVQAASRGLGLLQSALLSLGAAITVRQLTQYADAWTNAENRIRLFTKSSQETTRIQGELFRAAQETRSAFGETVELYQRLAQNADALGVSQERIIGLTETINQSLVISGTASASAAAALTQLGQAFASGQLRGEELNSVLEQAPRLARAIADGLGVQVGQLRKLGEQGKITAQDLIGAIESQAKTLSGEFAKINRTFGQSLTELNNEFIKFVGELDDSLHLTEGLTGVIKTLSENLDVAADGVAALAGAMFVLTSARILTGLATLATVIKANPLLTLGTLAVSGIAFFKDEIKPLGDGVTTLNDLFKALVVTLLDADKKFLNLLDTARAFAKERLVPPAGGSPSGQGTQGNPYAGPATVASANRRFDIREALPYVQSNVEAATSSLNGLSDAFDRVAPGILGVTQQLTSFKKVTETLTDGATQTKFEFTGSAATAAITGFGLLATAILSIQSPVRTFADEMLIASRATESHTRALEEYVSTITTATRTQVEQVGASAQLFEQSIGNLLRSSVVLPSVKNELVDFFRFGPISEKDVNLAGQRTDARVTLESLSLSESQFRQIAKDLFAGIDPKLGTQSIIDDLLARSSEALYASRNFGDIDARTVAGASELFQREARIRQPGSLAETQALLQSAFAEFGREQGVGSVFDFEAGLVNPLLDVTNRELLTLQELLSETRDFSSSSSSFYRQTLAASKSNSLYFDKEEAALRTRFALEFTGDPAKDRGTSQRFDREIQALYQIRLAYERNGAVVPGGSVGSTGAAKGSSVAGGSGTGSTVVVGADLATFPTLGELEASIDIMLSAAVKAILQDELAQIQIDRPLLTPEILVRVPDAFQFRQFFEDDGRLGTPLGEGLDLTLKGLVPTLRFERSVFEPGALLTLPGRDDYFNFLADAGRLVQPVQEGFRAPLRNLPTLAQFDPATFGAGQFLRVPGRDDYFNFLADDGRLVGAVEKGFKKPLSDLPTLAQLTPGLFEARQFVKTPLRDDYFFLANDRQTLLDPIEKGFNPALVDLPGKLSLTPGTLDPTRLLALPDRDTVFFKLGETVAPPLFEGVAAAVRSVRDAPPSVELRPDALVALSDVGKVSVNRDQVFALNIGRRLFNPDELTGLNTYVAKVGLGRDELFSLNVGRRLYGPTDLAGFNTYLSKTNLGRDELFSLNVGRRLYNPNELAGLYPGGAKTAITFDNAFSVNIARRSIPADQLVTVHGAVGIPSGAFQLPAPRTVDINDLFKVSGTLNVNQAYIPAGLFDRGNA